MAFNLDNVSYGNVIGALVLAVLVNLVGVVFYRLFLHPLAKYPGPFWARISAWPSYLWTTKQDRHIWLYNLHAKYGPVVRYRPDAIAFNTVDAYRDVFGTGNNMNKTRSYYRVWPHRTDLVNTWNAIDPAVHNRKRRTLANAFSDRALREAEPLVKKNIDRWIDLLGDSIPDNKGAESWSPSYNMAEQANYLVFDILGDLCFGQSFEMKEPESQLRHVPHLLMTFMQLLHPLSLAPFAPFWLWLKPRGLDWLLAYTVPQGLIDWQIFVGKCLANRTAKEQKLDRADVLQGKYRKDFFHHLYAAKEPDSGESAYSVSELYNEIELLTIAGSDTTSTVLAALTFYLVKYPAVQDKLAKEIGAAFASSSDIVAGPALQQCQYLRAVISEALRISPPVPAELAREVMSGGTTVAGHFFGPGTKVSTSLFCINLNPQLYPDPFDFRPGRFLVKSKEHPEGSTQDKVVASEAALVSFSMGSRGCIGKNLAWMEMQLALAKLVYAFEIRQKDGDNLGGGGPLDDPGHQDPKVYQLRDAFVAVRNGPMVQFRKRARE